MKKAVQPQPKPLQRLGRSPMSGQYVFEPAVRGSAARSAKIREAVRAVVQSAAVQGKRD